MPRLACTLLAILLTAESGSFANAQKPKGAHVPTPSKWRLDQQKSDFGGSPAPKSDEITFLTDTPEKFAWTEDSVDPDGNENHMSFAGAPDGVLHPMGNDGDQASFSPDLVKGRLVFRDGTTIDCTQSVSEDGKILTQLTIVHQANGSDLNIKLVYERVE